MVAYRPLGNTGLEVSELSIGGAAIGNEYGGVESAEAIEAVRFAIDHGLNFVDTSPYYGRTVSETRLGEALDGGYRDRVVLATKAGRYGKEAGFDYSYDRIMRSWNESSERLRTDYIDVYQLHDVEFVREEVIVEQAWPAMARLREQGKVGHIGITGYPLGYLARLASGLDPKPETVLTFCHYNLLNTTFDDLLLPTVRDLGIGVINASITHMGILTEQGPPSWHPAPDEICAMGADVVRFVTSHGARVTDVALMFAMAHASVATTCVGMSTTEEVVQNLGVIDKRVDHELLAGIQELVSPVKDVNWIQGIAEYSDPGSVPNRQQRE